MPVNDPMEKLKAMKEMSEQCKASAKAVAGAKDLLDKVAKAQGAAKTAKKELDGEEDDGEELG